MVAQGEFTIKETPTYIFMLIQLIVPLQLGKFTVLKLAEPHPPHLLFFAWRSLEVFACGWISFDYLDEHPPAWLQDSGSWGTGAGRGLSPQNTTRFLAFYKLCKTKGVYIFRVLHAKIHMYFAKQIPTV